MTEDNMEIDMSEKWSESFFGARAEKVKILKEQIEQGKYTVKPLALAEKLIDDAFESTFF